MTIEMLGKEFGLKVCFSDVYYCTLVGFLFNLKLSGVLCWIFNIIVYKFHRISYSNHFFMLCIVYY